MDKSSDTQSMISVYNLICNSNLENTIWFASQIRNTFNVSDKTTDPNSIMKVIIVKD